MASVQTPPATDADSPRPDGDRVAMHSAVLHQEHVMTTHLAVIEGWLGLLGDDALDPLQCRRAACVVRERTEALRRDMGVLIQIAKDSVGPAGATLSQ